MTPQSLSEQAIQFHQRGQLAEAERLYRLALESEPGTFTPHHMLGILRLQQGRHQEALNEIGAALQINPVNAEALINYGNAQKLLGLSEEALASFDKAGALRPDFAAAPYNRAILLADLGRFEEALAGYEQAVRLRPDFAAALYDRALLLHSLERVDAALAGFEALLAIQPMHADALNNRGVLLMTDHRPEDALVSFNKALAINPGFAEALHNRGNALNSLRRFEEALASYDQALALKPDSYARAWTNRGILLQNMRRFDEAMASFTRALAIEPANAEALNHRGKLAWLEFKRYEQATADLEKAVAKDPDFPYARGYLLYLKMHGGDWRAREGDIALVDAGVRAGKPVVEPFIYQGVCGSPAALQACAVIYAAHQHPAAPPVHRQRRPPGKIRVGYVSGEFREQATAYLTAGLYECHDKDRFEIVALDNGQSDGSGIRKRLEAAFDRFLDISSLSDAAAAALIADQRIDILVNLNGYFGERRTGIFARKPAPIQVNYLGFPGTLGAPYMDYIIADDCVIPQGEYRYYTEQVVILPDSYQPNDSKRAIAQGTPSRAACGLPPDGFVFCNFNTSYKLTPEIFDRWMRILKRTPGGVLWLLQGDPRFADNIRREAAARDVDGDRIVFAPLIPAGEHLARLKLADLFLDTLPYNAHTTASDSLWAGVPLLTCRGNSFAGRVAASLLGAIGLPELVTEDLAAYEALAVKLADDSVLLAELRERLAKNRLSMPLFDTVHYCRHLEAAYQTMADIHSQGLPPRSFTVPALA